MGTILTGLMSFMYDDAIATGSMKASGSERRRLAAQSLEASLRDVSFRKLFPEYIQELEDRKKAEVRPKPHSHLSAEGYRPYCRRIGDLGC